MSYTLSPFIVSFIIKGDKIWSKLEQCPNKGQLVSSSSIRPNHDKHQGDDNDAKFPPHRLGKGALPQPKQP